MCKYLFLSLSLAEFPPEANLRQSLGASGLFARWPQEALVGRWGSDTRRDRARQGLNKNHGGGSQGSALLGTSGRGYE